MKSIKQVYILSVIVLLIFGFLFYWFQIRPANIRAKCARWAAAVSVEHENKLQGTFKGTTFNQFYFENTYQACILKEGLSK